MSVHFVLTGGGLTPQYRRALTSAAVHGAEVTLWHTVARPAGAPCPTYRLRLPRWLDGEAGSTVYDYACLRVLHDHGGMFLGLDTISVRPALDLLDGEVTVAADVPLVDGVYVGARGPCEHPFNNNMLAEQGSPILLELLDELERRVRSGTMGFGDTGPALLTPFVDRYPGRVTAAAFPALCGWEGSYVWRHYLGEQPSPETRVIHLFASAYPELYEGRVEKWRAKHPGLVLA